MSQKPKMIHFKCKSCELELAVPTELAGVSGPCPNCGTIITSPTPTASQSSVIAKAERAKVEVRNPEPSILESKADLPERKNAVIAPKSPDASLPAQDLTSNLPPVSIPPNSLPDPQVRTRPRWDDDDRSDRSFRDPYSNERISSKGPARWATLVYAILALLVIAVCVGFFYSDQLKEKIITYLEAQRLEEMEEFEEKLAKKSEDKNEVKAPISPADSSPAVAPQENDPEAVKQNPESQPETPKLLEPQPENVTPHTPVKVEEGMTAEAAPPKMEEKDEAKEEVVELSAPRPTANESAPKSEIIVEATPAVEGAVEAIKKFCAAKTWEERAELVQFEKQVKPMMQKFYEVNSYKPVNLAYIRLMYHEKSKEEGENEHAVFQISGSGLSKPIPVMAENRPEGWRIDWLAFTEFSEELLERFMNDYVESTTRFRVMIRRKAYFGNVKLRDKHSFEITPPFPGFEAYVFVEKNSPLAAELEKVLPWNRPSLAVIAELKWKKEGELKWVELVSLPQLNWKNNGPEIPKAEKVD